MGVYRRTKVLVADDDGVFARATADFLKGTGFEAKIASNGKEAKLILKEWKPRFILADLMLPSGNALELLKFIQTDDSMKNHLINLLIVSGHNSEKNVRQAFAHGAVDYIVKPVKYNNLLQRLIFQFRQTRKVKEISDGIIEKDEASFLLYLVDIMMRLSIKSQDASDILFNLTKMVSNKMDGVRCNIIRYFNQNEGVVLASSDDKSAAGIRLDLNKYPEVVTSVNTRHTIAIDDLDQDDDFKAMKDHFVDIDFNSMVVCPIEDESGAYGVLSIRMAKGRKKVTNNEMRFLSVAAHMVSLVLHPKNLSNIKDIEKIAG